MAIPETNCVDIDTPCFPSSDMGRFGQVINLYVENPVLSDTELTAWYSLLQQLPPPEQHGVRTRVWRFFYPLVDYPGLTVGMRDVTVAASTEVLVPLASFDINNVPWEKL